MASRESNPRKREDERSPPEPGQDGLQEHQEQNQIQGQDAPPGDEHPDVTLDVPSFEIEELKLEVETLRGRISLQAELADMVKLNIGVEAVLDNAALELKGAQAQGILKVRLDNVRAILGQALKTIDNNPQVLEGLARIAEQTAGTAERAFEGPAGKIGGAADQGGRTDTGETGEPDATDAARRKAEELGIDLSQVEGTGSAGRILIRDVLKAAKG